MSMLAGYAAFIAVVRTVLLGLAALVTLICVLDWVVRTRRISPFNPVARFFRARVDPLMRPVETVVVRHGGLPANAPWWTLATIVVGGILLVTLLELIGGVLAQGAMGLQVPSQVPWILLSWLFSLLQVALLVRVVASWLPISPYSKWIRWTYPLTNWMLRPIQRLIPPIGGRLDLSPLIAWFLLNLLRGLILH